MRTKLLVAEYSKKNNIYDCFIQNGKIYNPTFVGMGRSQF